jgi:hypothetical protein
MAVTGLRSTRVWRPVVRRRWLGRLRGLGRDRRWARPGESGDGCFLVIGRRTMACHGGARRRYRWRRDRWAGWDRGPGRPAGRMGDHQDDATATFPGRLRRLGLRCRRRRRRRLGRWCGRRCRCRRRSPRRRARRRLDGGRGRCRAGARRGTRRGRRRRQRDGRRRRGTGCDLVRSRQPGDAEAERDARQHEVDDAERDDQTEALCGGHAVRSLLDRGSLTSRPLRRW